MSLGDRLRISREKKGWSQVYVSKILDITSQTISNYERNERDPDSSTLNKLAELYDVSADYLLGRTDDPTPKNSALSALFKKFIELMKDERGAMPPENTLLALAQMAQLYAVSKGVPPSVIADQLSQVDKIPDKEKARLADEIDGILQDESNAASELAKEIESLPERERQAMEAMLEVLKNKSGDAAAQES